MPRYRWINMRRCLALGISLFWLAMMGSLLYDYFWRRPSGYRGLLAGLKVPRRNVMGIYLNDCLRIGCLRTMITPKSDGTFEINTASALALTPQDRQALGLSGTMINWLLQLWGLKSAGEQTIDIQLRSVSVIGPDYRLKNLSIYLKSRLLRFNCSGKVANGRLHLSITCQGQVLQQVLPIRQDSITDSGLGPSTMPAGLQIGQSWHDVLVNPLTGKSTRLRLQVTGRQVLQVAGHPVDTWVVQSVPDYGPRSVSWVTAQGEIVKHKVLFITLIQEKNS